MRLNWLLMVGPIYVGIVMGFLHPEHWLFIGSATLVSCFLLWVLGDKIK